MGNSATRWPELVSLAVHELRSPAGVVSGYVKMLLDGQAGPLTPPQRQLLELAAASSADVVAILGDLSTFARIEGGRLALPVQVVRAAALLEEAVRQLYKSPPGLGVPLEIQGPVPDATVAVDFVRASRGVAALASAVARMDPTSTVAAWVNATDESLTLTLTPLTVGRPADCAPVAPLDEAKGGLGVALPLARLVLEAAAGRVGVPVWATSVPAVSIVLPIVTTE